MAKYIYILNIVTIKCNIKCVNCSIICTAIFHVTKFHQFNNHLNNQIASYQMTWSHSQIFRSLDIGSMFNDWKPTWTRSKNIAGNRAILAQQVLFSTCTLSCHQLHNGFNHICGNNNIVAQSNPLRKFWKILVINVIML